VLDQREGADLQFECLVIKFQHEHEESAFLPLHMKANPPD